VGRSSEIKRTTGETDVTVKIDLDGKGRADISTGIGFFDHMLVQVAKHGFFDLDVNAKGDLDVDCHHTVEDVGITLGQAVSKALGGREGIARYADETVPMEDALILCALDISGRPYLAFDCAFPSEKIGGMDTEMIEEFFRAVCLHAGLNLHIRTLAGKNSHHIAEAAFKAFGRAMNRASSIDPRISGVLSTKGTF
jgi:imidazoleglycerol-phosphate dehydratase